MKFSKTDNFDKVYETAKLLMYAVPIKSHESIPTFCSHPFTDFIYVPKMENNKIIKTYDLLNLDDFKEWSSALLQRLQHGKLETIFYIVSKPYRLTFLKYAQPYLTKETFSELFGDIWITSENPNGDVNVSLRTLISWFKHADKQKLMGNDYETWRLFPAEMTLF